MLILALRKKIVPETVFWQAKDKVLCGWSATRKLFFVGLRAATWQGPSQGWCRPRVTATSPDVLAPKFFDGLCFCFQPDETKYTTESALVQATAE